MKSRSVVHQGDKMQEIDIEKIIEEGEKKFFQMKEAAGNQISNLENAFDFFLNFNMPDQMDKFCVRSWI